MAQSVKEADLIVVAGENHPLGRAQIYDRVRGRDGVGEDRWKVDGRARRGFVGVGVGLQAHADG